VSTAAARIVAAVAVAAAVALTAATGGATAAAGVAALVLVGVMAEALVRRSRRRSLQRLLGAPGTATASLPASWAALEEAVAEVVASRDRASDELARLEPPWTLLVASIEGPALLFSGDDRLVTANPAACELLGIPAPIPDLPLAQALGSSSIANAVREARALGSPVQVDAEVRGRDLRATASAVAEEILVIVADRTEQRRVEELRRNFVVNASHELKTPVTSIRALAEALEVSVERGSERTPALLARLNEESDRLVQLVHDLLDLRRLEDVGPLERAPVDLVTLTEEVVGDLRPGAAEAGVELTTELGDRAMVAGVSEDLRLVVDNLVSNAIRYNHPGGHVWVRLRRDGSAYVLEVADTGVGIPHADLQRVFERFYRVDVARSRERGGTGLGLSLVRNAVERHGGTVEVESLLGTGSTFTARLPIEPTQ